MNLSPGRSLSILPGAFYLWTEHLPREEVFGLKSRMRRAAVPIPSKLAKGAGRGTDREFSHFVTIDRASLNELEIQALLVIDMQMLKADLDLEQSIERLFGLLNGLRNALDERQTSVRAKRESPNA